MIIIEDKRAIPDGLWLGKDWHPLFKPTIPTTQALEPVQPQKQVEICRSFSYKLNLANHGGPQYESADFFASRKLSCNEDDAPAISQMIFEECVTEVREAISYFVKTMNARRRPAKEA